MKNKRTILFTGGGSAGHVTPNLALIKRFQDMHWTIVYIGSKNGIERKIIERTQIAYYAITTTKLHRYFSWKNFLIPIKLLCAITQAYFICKKTKPSVVFSKGGFVALPVVIAAWLNRIPIMVHESDLSPGLANRLSFPFSQCIAITAAITARSIKQKSKLLLTGTPIRENLLQGKAERGLAYCGFYNTKPVLLIFTGSLGAKKINQAIDRILKRLLNTFQVIHIVGNDTKKIHMNNIAGYYAVNYLNEELADVMACADLVISRAGANAIYELLTLKKPHILIPLPAYASRGDQIENAHYFSEQGLSVVLDEDNLTDEKLLNTIMNAYRNLKNTKQLLKRFISPDSITIIYDRLVALAK